MKLRDDTLLKSAAYVDGAFLDAADDGRSFEVTNPATGEVLARLPDMGGPETRRAIEAAHAAWAGWRRLLAKERAAVMRRWFQLMMDNQEDLAVIMTAEQGKPLAESRSEIAYGASFIEWFAEEGKRLYGEVIPTFAQGRRVLATRQGVGVVGAVTPWNFPNAMITRKAGPALAAGCPIVLKPAAATPLSALALAELAHRAGVPKGVFNVIVSKRSSEVGEQLTTNPLVRKFTFTGSTEIGKQLLRQCASTVKKVSMELGGNAPFIVFDDADLDEAVKGAVASKFRNMGQTCVCANRFLVQDGVYDAFAEKLAAAAAALKVGDGLDEGVQQGPLIDENAVRKVENLVADALEKGARLVVGGARHARGGAWYQPTVLADMTTAMRATQDEIFGPVATLYRFRDEDDAIRMANDTPFGLASYVYTRDVGRVWRVSEALDYGIVGVNEGVISSEVAPFGGFKESGLGREGGPHGIDDYLETKHVSMGGLGG